VSKPKTQLQHIIEPAIIPNESPSNRPKKNTEDVITQWSTAIPEYQTYKAGTFEYPVGSFYDFPAGIKMIIKQNGEEREVMDSCEAPWSLLTARELSDGFKKGPLKIIECGFGLGILSTAMMWELAGIPSDKPHEYYIIELNNEVVKQAQQWAKNIIPIILRMTPPGLPHIKPPEIRITIIHGEASTELNKLAQSPKQKDTIDLIASDTYPVETTTKGLNDLGSLPAVCALLKPLTGRFAYYPYTPGPQREIQRIQEELVDNFFRKSTKNWADVNPNPDYQYLRKEDGLPVRRLKVMVCKDPYK